jgi:hypothetical protein
MGSVVLAVLDRHTRAPFASAADGFSRSVRARALKLSFAGNLFSGRFSNAERDVEKARKAAPVSPMERAPLRRVPLFHDNSQRLVVPGAGPLAVPNRTAKSGSR